MSSGEVEEDGGCAMQRIPVDLAGCLVLCTEVPVPKVRDGRQQSDARSGELLFTVGVCVIQARTSDVVAVPWEQSDGGRSRHGIAFRAESVKPATAAASGSGKAAG
jgi:hypothetical protein